MRWAGPSRNFQVFEPLDFLAEVTQWSTTISSARTMRASSTEAMAASHHVRPPLSRPVAPRAGGDRSEGATGTAHQGKVPSEDRRMPRPTVPATVPPGDLERVGVATRGFLRPQIGRHEDQIVALDAGLERLRDAQHRHRDVRGHLDVAQDPLGRTRPVFASRFPPTGSQRSRLAISSMVTPSILPPKANGAA